MDRNDLRALAVVGATARLGEIQREIDGLERFLGRPKPRRPRPAPRTATPTRRPMSRTNRLAVSRRMKAYWKAKRQAKWASM